MRCLSPEFPRFALSFASAHVFHRALSIMQEARTDLGFICFLFLFLSVSSLCTLRRFRVVLGLTPVSSTLLSQGQAYWRSLWLLQRCPCAGRLLGWPCSLPASASRHFLSWTRYHVTTPLSNTTKPVVKPPLSQSYLERRVARTSRET